MRAAPIGTEVGLYVDLVERVHPFDVIETRSGRRYGVLSVRVQSRGKRAGRQHLRVVVLAPGQGPGLRAKQVGDGIDLRPGKIHRIRWYVRGRASGGVKPKGRR